MLRAVGFRWAHGRLPLSWVRTERRIRSSPRAPSTGTGVEAIVQMLRAALEVSMQSCRMRCSAALPSSSLAAALAHYARHCCSLRPRWIIVKGSWPAYRCFASIGLPATVAALLAPAVVAAVAEPVAARARLLWGAVELVAVAGAAPVEAAAAAVAASCPLAASVVPQFAWRPPTNLHHRLRPRRRPPRLPFTVLVRRRGQPRQRRAPRAVGVPL
mmetsp:Transcript_140410/g.350026  ORF Transcript_140410/g.350026 Transcript_140410/m.350026 type:complete len:215 (-) Transcript_140410:71-715(-)